MTPDILLYLIILLIIIISVYLLSHKWADAVKSYSSVAVSPLISFVILALGDTWQMETEKCVLISDGDTCKAVKDICPVL